MARHSPMACKMNRDHAIQSVNLLRPYSVAYHKSSDNSYLAMGDIPSVANMVTTIILSPAPGEDLEPNKDFEIKLRIGSLVAGSFTNPQVTYYSAPQRLDKSGRIIGHVHVRILRQHLYPRVWNFLLI